MKSVLKAIDLLEENGYYKMADHFQNQLIKISAWPYNLTSLDELPMSARNTQWQSNKEDYEQYNDLFWKELKQRLPDYRQLNTDKDDDQGLEKNMHGPDAVPGPAYVDPTSPASSPSMNGSLDYFTWDQAHDANQGPEYWKNLTPRR
jgi:hypothetical protein